MRTIEQITIGTRCSRLAVRQAESVAASLRLLFPQIPVTLKYIHTRGDKIVDRPLSAIGGKGLFTEEIEREILAGTIDLAVHSLKDVPAELPVDLTLGAITKREPAQDAFVSCHTMPPWPTCLRAPVSARPACAARPSSCMCGRTLT